jgi:hypothetical protein
MLQELRSLVARLSPKVLGYLILINPPNDSIIIHQQRDQLIPPTNYWIIIG